MASTFSPSLRIELIGDGDQSGIWGQTTNNNLGALIEQAIAGVVTITMLDSNYTMTNFNGVSDESRNQVIVLVGTNTAQRNLIAPLVEKTYIVKNTTTGGFAVQIIGSSGTGVVIPNGVTTSVYCDGTNFYSNLTGAVGNFNVAGNLAVTGTTTLTGALGGSTAVFSGAISSVSPSFTGTPTAITAAPGTNTPQIATTAFVGTAVTNGLGTLGTMSTQNANNVTITGGSITGITDLAVADGGTGRSTLTTNNVILGNGTSAVNFVAPGSSGNLLISNGTTWTSAVNPAQLIGTTWTSFSSVDRQQGVDYPNSTGRYIQVQGNFGCNFNGQGKIFIDGNEISFWQAQFNGCGGYSVNMPCLVPPGSTYRLESMNGAFRSWWELR
jgi:hypothetical protein